MSSNDWNHHPSSVPDLVASSCSSLSDQSSSRSSTSTLSSNGSIGYAHLSAPVASSSSDKTAFVDHRRIYSAALPAASACATSSFAASFDVPLLRAQPLPRSHDPSRLYERQFAISPQHHHQQPAELSKLNLASHSHRSAAAAAAAAAAADAAAAAAMAAGAAAGAAADQASQEAIAHKASSSTGANYGASILSTAMDGHARELELRREALEGLQQAANYASLKQDHGLALPIVTPAGAHASAERSQQKHPMDEDGGPPRLSTSSAGSSSSTSTTSEIATPESYQHNWTLPPLPPKERQLSPDLDALPPRSDALEPNATQTNAFLSRPAVLERFPSNLTNTTVHPSSPASSASASTSSSVAPRPTASPAQDSIYDPPPVPQSQASSSGSSTSTTLTSTPESSLMARRSSPSSSGRPVEGLSIVTPPMPDLSGLSIGSQRCDSRRWATISPSQDSTSTSGSSDHEAHGGRPRHDTRSDSYGAPSTSSPGGMDSVLGEEAAAGRSRTISGVSSRASLASPDSWRSLLPEHDPYFSPAGSFTASSSRLTTLGEPFSQGSTALPLDHRRFSNGSQMSSFSLPGPTPAPPSNNNTFKDSESWRSLLPEGDQSRPPQSPGGRSSVPASSPPLPFYPAEGSRAAFAPLGNPGYEEAASASAARRHASFSSYDALPRAGTSGFGKGYGVGGNRGYGGRAGTDYANSTGNMPGDPSHLTHAPFVHPPTTYLPPTSIPAGPGRSSTIADADERESWPSSRSGSQRMMSNGGAGVYVASGSAIDGIPDLAAQLARGQVGHRQTQLAAAAPRTIATSSANPTVHFPDVGAPIAAPGTVVTTTTTHTTTTTTLLPALAGKPAPPVAASDLSGAPIDDDASGRTVSSRASSCSVSTPLSPPSLPFLDHRPAPPETDLAIETSTHNYTLITRLPGFSIDCITLATKHHRTLHIVADKWDQDSGGHFERRITFGTDAEMKNVKAEFDGNLLKVFVPRRTQTAMNKTGGGASSSSSARF